MGVFSDLDGGDSWIVDAGGVRSEGESGIFARLSCGGVLVREIYWKRTGGYGRGGCGDGFRKFKLLRLQFSIAISYFKIFWALLCLFFVGFFRASGASAFTVGSAWSNPFGDIRGMWASDYNFLTFGGSGKRTILGTVLDKLKRDCSLDAGYYKDLLQRSVETNYDDFQRILNELDIGSSLKYLVMTSKTPLLDPCSARRISLTANSKRFITKKVFPITTPASFLFSRNSSTLAAAFGDAVLFAAERGIFSAASRRADFFLMRKYGQRLCVVHTFETGKLSFKAMRRIFVIALGAGVVSLVVFVAEVVGRGKVEKK